MSTEVERAIALLFPASGRRALDVKFFFQQGATADALARQIAVSYQVLADDSCTIQSIDGA